MNQSYLCFFIRQLIIDEIIRLTFQKHLKWKVFADLTSDLFFREHEDVFSLNFDLLVV